MANPRGSRSPEYDDIDAPSSKKNAAAAVTDLYKQDPGLVEAIKESMGASYKVTAGLSGGEPASSPKPSKRMKPAMRRGAGNGYGDD